MANAVAEYHEKFDGAFAEELSYVEARWRAKERRRWEEEASLRYFEALARGDTAAAAAIEQEPAPDDTSFDKDRLLGLALSGGGIRSASFCMGVVQQLHVAGVMDRFHYMSTVSGGGYTGCSLTWFMSRGFGTEPDNFPFWGGAPAAVRLGADETARKPKRGPIDGRTVLDYIRQRASYLNPGAGFSLTSAAAIVLRSTLTSLFAFVLLGALILWTPVRYGWFKPQSWALGLNVPSAAGIALLLMFATLVVYYSLATGIRQSDGTAYEGRRLYQRLAGHILALALGMFAVALLHWLTGFLSSMNEREPKFDAAGFAAAASAVGALGGLLTHKSADAKPGIAKSMVMAVVPLVSLLLLVAGLAMLSQVAAEAAARVPWGLPALVLLLAIYGVFTNVNLTGLHRFYRDRLMETFMPDPARIPDDRQAAPTDADTMLLADICGMETDGPYHLVNAHVVLLGARKARQRSRMGDSFVLSRCYSGSEATGFIRTSDWVSSSGLPFLRPLGPMRLPTAMAISGAAMNPRAGADGQGATKGPVVSALLTVLNLRLGYWAQSPLKIHRAGGKPVYRLPPNLIRPGTIQGLFALSHNERAHWLELTDGGHFENTALYELVRRRVRTIVFADGSTDPDISLSSFANVLQKIYVDFGVTLTFGEPADFTRMMKGSAIAQPGDVLSKRFELSAAAYSVGTIRYPREGDRDEMIGTLLYIKSAMTQGLPPGLYSYKAGNPQFPSESLAEQFFSEEQFEAYRALGFMQASSLVADVKINAKWSQDLGFPIPPPPPPPPIGAILTWILGK
jgi:hypothetical protein